MRDRSAYELGKRFAQSRIGKRILNARISWRVLLIAVILYYTVRTITS